MVHVPRSASPQKIGREKTLNLIYFVDSNSTRSIRISLGRVWLIGAILVSVLLWAMGSVWLLYRSQQKFAQGQERIRQLQAGIFKYQNYSGRVYDVAYPSGVSGLERAKLAVKSNESSQKSPESIAKSDNKTKVAPTKEQRQVKAQPVKVEGPKFVGKNNSLIMKYLIKNPAKTGKVAGRIWGIARYAALDGSHHYISYPTGVGASKEGAPLNPVRGTRFHIKRFRNVEARFEIPRGIEGKFDKVVIHAKSNKGVLTQEEIPVAIEFGYKKPGKLVPSKKNVDQSSKSRASLGSTKADKQNDSLLSEPQNGISETPTELGGH